MSEPILLRKKKFCLLVSFLLPFFFFFLIVCFFFLRDNLHATYGSGIIIGAKPKSALIYKSFAKSAGHLLLSDVCRLHPNQSESCYLFAILNGASDSIYCLSLVQILNVVPLTSPSHQLLSIYNL